MSELVGQDQGQKYGQDHGRDQSRDDRPAGAPRPPHSSWTERITDLAHLAGRPLADHADTYDALHADLKRRLGEVDGH